MTVADPAVSLTAPPQLGRIGRIVRLHYANRWNTVLLPVLVLTLIFAINLTIWVLVNTSAGAPTSFYSGGVFFLPCYLLAASVQAFSLTFPFALGMSATRRDYYLGTVATFGIQSAAFAIVITLLSYPEQWTHGWGQRGVFFLAAAGGQGLNPAERLLTVFATLLCACFIGSVAGAVFQRYRANGLYALGLGFTVLSLAAAAVVTFSHGWGAVWAWFGRTGPEGVAAWSLVPAAVFALVGYAVLRRSTPRG